MARDMESMEDKAGRAKLVKTGLDSKLRTFHRKNYGPKRY